ncbi:MAG: WYL domain-containing protein [Myxococcota bacterium]
MGSRSATETAIAVLTAFIESDPASPIRVAFTVSDPEARWVKDTLPIPMKLEPEPDGGIRATAETAGIQALARFLVGLGEAARAETPELIRAVHHLAQGALAAHSPSIRSVTSIRSTDESRGTPSSLAPSRSSRSSHDP